VHPDLSPLIQHFGPWLLVFNRVLGLLLFTPLLSSATIPMRFRALLAAGLAAGVYGFLPPEWRVMPDATLATHAGMLFGELLIGAAIGFIAGLPFVALEMAGHLMGHQMALSLAQSYNPELEANLNSIGSLLFFMGIAAFVFMGGPEMVFTILVSTFETIPLGALDPRRTPVDLVVEALTAGTELAVRISAPTTGVIMAVLVAMGFIMRTMPQINVLSVGFAIKILAGVSIMLFALFAINTAIADFIAQTLSDLARWAAAP
jgi:flagellar biosynthetic protein FliR